MTIKNEAELKARVDAPPFRSVTAADIFDVIDSRFSVGGQMGSNFSTMEVTRNVWMDWSAFVESSEKGLIPDLLTGQFTLDPALAAGTDGTYNIDVGTILTVTQNMTLQLAITVNGARTEETPTISMQPNDPKSIPLLGREELVGGDIVGMQVLASWTGGVDTTNIGADLSQFRVTRT